VEGGEFDGELSDFQFLRKDSATWSYEVPRLEGLQWHYIHTEFNSNQSISVCSKMYMADAAR